MYAPYFPVHDHTITPPDTHLGAICWLAVNYARGPTNDGFHFLGTLAEQIYYVATDIELNSQKYEQTSFSEPASIIDCPASLPRKMIAINFK